MSWPANPRVDPGGGRRGLLSGLRVIDTTRFLAGPYAGQMLGDMGADVIKIEDTAGDSTRAIPPYSVGGDSAYYASANRNKRSVVLDLKSDEARSVLASLVVDADVVLDNLRPAQREKLGLGWDQLSQLNPSIVSASITGFGSTGPYADRPAYDMVVQALSGVMSLTGEAGGTAYRTGVPLGDLAGGMNAVIGLLAALYDRQVTGLGQHIDISLLDGQVSMLSYLASYYSVSDRVPLGQGRAHDSIPTYNTFTAADGEDVVVAAVSERMWQGLCGALEVPDLTAEERYATNGTRYVHRDELHVTLDAAFKRFDADEVLKRLLRAGVPCARINTVDRVFDDPQVNHRDMIMSISYENGEVFRAVGNPIKASRSNFQPTVAPPRLGADTDSVLRAVRSEIPEDLGHE